MRSTANPGGVGHGWVKQYFVTAGTPGETIWLSDKVIMPDGTTKIIGAVKSLLRRACLTTTL